MASSKEKDIILKAVNEATSELGQIDYNSVFEKSGLNNHVFQIAFKEIEEDKFIETINVNQSKTFLYITNSGKYFYETDGGYTSKEKKEKDIENKKKTEERILKILPIVISTLALLWTIINSKAQKESAQKLEIYKKSADSLVNQLEIYKKSTDSVLDEVHKNFVKYDDDTISTHKINDGTKIKTQ